MAAKLLQIKIIPNSKINKIVEQKENFYKIKLMAPAVEGKANKSLLSFLSGLLKIPKSKIEIAKGEKSREKTIRISD